MPSVRLLDGSSGGGSVAAMVPQQKKEGESTAKESSGAITAGRPRVAGGGGSFLPGHLGSSEYAAQLANVPVVNVLLGSVVGIGAAKAVLGHFSVMVRDIAQLFVAGPPVVQHAMGYDVTKEALGGWHIHCRNGAVDNLAETEDDAMAMTRRFLSYLPSSVYEPPPVRDGPARSARSPRRRALHADSAQTHEHVRRSRGDPTARRRGFVLRDRASVGRRSGDRLRPVQRSSDGCHRLRQPARERRCIDGGRLRQADASPRRVRRVSSAAAEPRRQSRASPSASSTSVAATIRKGGEWMIAFAQVSDADLHGDHAPQLRRCGQQLRDTACRDRRCAWCGHQRTSAAFRRKAASKRRTNGSLRKRADPRALRDELMARIESVRGPVGPLSRFQMEEMIDPRDTRTARLRVARQRVSCRPPRARHARPARNHVQALAVVRAGTHPPTGLRWRSRRRFPAEQIVVDRDRSAIRRGNASAAWALHRCRSRVTSRYHCC